MFEHSGLLTQPVAHAANRVDQVTARPTDICLALCRRRDL